MNAATIGCHGKGACCRYIHGDPNEKAMMLLGGEGRGTRDHKIKRGVEDVNNCTINSCLKIFLVPRAERHEYMCSVPPSLGRVGEVIMKMGRRGYM